VRDLPFGTVDGAVVLGQSGCVRRLLLTSAGVRNATIRDALLDLLGRPIEDCTALCIPTAMYGHPHHLDHESLPENTLAHAETWAAGLDCPAYAIDDETAIRVVDGAVDVVSEGHWQRFDA
jgi:hypothetical protein